MDRNNTWHWARPENAEAALEPAFQRGSQLHVGERGERLRQAALEHAFQRGSQLMNRSWNSWLTGQRWNMRSSVDRNDGTAWRVQGCASKRWNLRSNVDRNGPDDIVPARARKQRWNVRSNVDSNACAARIWA